MKNHIENLAKTDSVYGLDWDLLNEIGASLNLVANSMTALQRQDILLSDVYAQWLLLMDQLHELGTDFSQALLTSIRARFSNIFKTDCEPMLACIWLDPRYQLTLTTEEKEVAKRHLIGLYERLSKMEEDEHNAGTATELIDNEENEHESRLEKIMKSYEKEANANGRAIQMSEILDSFDNMERMPTRTDPRKYWRDRKMSAPQIYSLSKIILAVPGSQAAVERNFSTLNRTLTKFRSGLSDDTLERILFMSCNRALFDKNLFDSL